MDTQPALRFRALRPALLGLFLLSALLLAIPGLCAAAGLDWAKVEIFGHRGFTLHQPENSLGALRAAHEIGLHGSEVDLHTTADGVLVLLHDDTVDRTTNGRGSIAGMSLAQARALILTGPGNQRIPTLDEALELIASWQNFRLVLDLKAADAAGVARRVAAKGLYRKVVIFTGSAENVAPARAVKAVDPRVQISVDLLSWWRIEGLPRFAARALDVDYLFASEWFFPERGFSEAAQAGAGVMAYLWGTQNLPARMERAVNLGAQVISCDRPDVLLQALRRKTAAEAQ